MQFWISGLLFVFWFLGYMVCDAGREIHFVFLLAVLITVEKIIANYKELK